MIYAFLSLIKQPFIFLKGWLMSFIIKDRVIENYPIDFVVTWVDGNDLEWRKSRDSFFKGYSKENNGEERYRDWEFFVYWFRAVEKYAPWVNKVYLVTCGHYPTWINLNHPKLVLVNHEEYMDSRYLPTFNSIPIELNLCKIKNLSEHFVYFNDDVFLTDYVSPDDFFRNGNPYVCSEARPLINTPNNSPFDHQLFSVIGMMNKYNWKEIIEKNPSKWFCHKLGVRLKYNWDTYQHGCLLGFYYTHLAQSFRKSTMLKVWNLFGDYLDECSQHKFRKSRDINHWIFTLHEIVEGSYYPMSRFNLGKFYLYIDTYLKEIKDDILKRRHKMICINDSQHINPNDFNNIKNEVLSVFKKTFPTKSSFEI